MVQLSPNYSTGCIYGLTNRNRQFLVVPKGAFVEKPAVKINKIQHFRNVAKRPVLNFPFVFEILIWIFYVGLYKYAYYVDQPGLHAAKPSYFPFPVIGLYAVISTLYLLPYYRWAVPKLLYFKKYGWLVLLTLVYFLFITTLNNIAVAWIFKQFASAPEQRFFRIMSAGFYMDWNLILTDAIAFLCISFSRFSFRNEQQRHLVETDHLQLQLSMLKSQLQPHFLFNTLNSLYGMSLTGAKETPRYILLLSQMMQYILYDCDKDEVTLEEEVTFLQGYFEIEQKKFPGAKISFTTPEQFPDIKIPPLLFLPLVENSFKHGRHKLENDAQVAAKLLVADNKLVFEIKNDMLLANILQNNNQKGGIGLVNIKKRLELYYPASYKLVLLEHDHIYTAKLEVELQ